MHLLKYFSHRWLEWPMNKLIRWLKIYVVTKRIRSHLVFSLCRGGRQHAARSHDPIRLPEIKWNYLDWWRVYHHRLLDTSQARHLDADYWWNTRKARIHHRRNEQQWYKEITTLSFNSRLSDAIGCLEIFVNTGSGNGLLPDGTKQLPEPILRYTKWSIHLREI